MTPKARPLSHHLPHTAISVDALFAAAFHKSRRIYQHESLLGWRPVEMAPSVTDHPEKSPAHRKAPPAFSNSPDVKIRETSESITIEVELPDIDEESLYLEVSGDLLIIRAEKLAPKQRGSKSAKPHPPVLVNRFVQLPFKAKPGHIQARLDGDVLRIIIGDFLAHDLDTELI